MKSSHIPIPLRLVLLGAALLYTVFIVRTSFLIHGEQYFTLIDDAMISMRYAQHLAAGNGLVWNVGEPPVEGFSNLGWMLLMGLLHLIPLASSKISLVVMAASAVILLANCVIVYRICEVLVPRNAYAPLLATFITAFYYPLVFWSLRGMEVGLLSLLVNLGLFVCVRLKPKVPQREVLGLGIIQLFALVVRLDSILQVAILLAYAVSAQKFPRRQAVLLLVIVLGSMATILTFQGIYFGDLLPNTYYLKVAGASITERLKNGILVFNQYATRDTLAMVFLTAGGIWLYKAMRTRATVLMGALFLIQCAYSIWVGGDYAEPEVGAANRFITQGMPPLIILFSLAADGIISDVVARRSGEGKSKSVPKTALSLAVASAVVLVISGTPWLNWGIDNAPLLKSDIRRVRIGISVATNTAPSASIAVHAAGQIPYYSDRRTIDLLGINDPKIAMGPLAGPFYPGHDKWNYDYSISQLQPDLIADNWIRLGEYMRNNSDYRQLENGMYVRQNSTLVIEAGLVKLYP